MTNSSSRTLRPWGLLLFLSLHAGAAWLAFRSASPQPVPANEPGGSELSVTRMDSTLETLMGVGLPHPAGSEEQAAVRERLLALLRAEGFEPELQTEFVCGPFRHYCGQITNVLVRLRGRGRAGAVLLNAHYDTQPATPGAADCMAGVASLVEIARVLAGRPALDRDVVFLFNDGEEAGLLGATAFVEHHPWAADVEAVVNLEARGSGGPSWPAYTVGEDRQLLAAYSRSTDRPAAGSAGLALTSLLPLTNDLAVFERLGKPGVTLGFARHPRRYHTPRDDLQHLSRASLLQQAGAALGITLELARADSQKAGEGAGQGVFFTVGGWSFDYRLDLALPAALVAILALAALLARSLRQPRGNQGEDHPGRLRPGRAARALLVFVLSIPACYLPALMVEKLRSAWTETASPFVSAPLATYLGFVLCGLAMAVLLLASLRTRCGEWESLFGLWAGWSLAALAATFWAPRAGYLFLAPLVLALGLEALLPRRWPWRWHVLCALPGFLAMALWYAHLVIALDLLGLAALPFVAFLVTIAASLSAPLVEGRARWLAAAAAAVAACVALGLGLRVPTFTTDDPQAGNLIYVLDTESHTAQLAFTGYPLADALAATADWGDWQTPLDWAPREAGLVASAPALDLPPPRLEIDEVSRTGDELMLRGRVLSPRGAPVLQWVFPAGSAPRRAILGGVEVPDDESTYPLFAEGYEVYTVHALPPQGLPFELVLPAGAASGFRLADRSYGLPPELAAVSAARPEWSVPIGPGDSATVVVRVDLPEQ